MDIRNLLKDLQKISETFLRRRSICSISLSFSLERRHITPEEDSCFSAWEICWDCPCDILLHYRTPAISC